MKILNLKIRIELYFAYPVPRHSVSNLVINLIRFLCTAYTIRTRWTIIKAELYSKTLILVLSCTTFYRPLPNVFCSYFLFPLLSLYAYKGNRLRYLERVPNIKKLTKFQVLNNWQRFFLSLIWSKCSRITKRLEDDHDYYQEQDTWDFVGTLPFNPQCNCVPFTERRWGKVRDPLGSIHRYLAASKKVKSEKFDAGVCRYSSMTW